jgi:ubiquinone/menaquinone biosynthesis C-methylase UbiE
MPYEEEQFDVVYGVQVIEYVPELDDALSEIYRVLRPGGRVVMLATNWNSIVWHSNRPGRMSEVLKAWDTHAPYPDLPSILPTRLRKAGIELLNQKR